MANGEIITPQGQWNALAQIIQPMMEAIRRQAQAQQGQTAQSAPTAATQGTSQDPPPPPPARPTSNVPLLSRRDGTQVAPSNDADRSPIQPRDPGMSFPSQTPYQDRMQSTNALYNMFQQSLPQVPQPAVSMHPSQGRIGRMLGLGPDGTIIDPQTGRATPVGYRTKGDLIAAFLDPLSQSLGAALLGKRYARNQNFWGNLIPRGVASVEQYRQLPQIKQAEVAQQQTERMKTAAEMMGKMAPFVRSGAVVRTAFPGDPNKELLSTRNPLTGQLEPIFDPATGQQAWVAKRVATSELKYMSDPANPERLIGFNRDSITGELKPEMDPNTGQQAFKLTKVGNTVYGFGEDGQYKDAWNLTTNEHWTWDAQGGWKKADWTTPAPGIEGAGGPQPAQPPSAAPTPATTPATPGLPPAMTSATPAPAAAAPPAPATAPASAPATAAPPAAAPATPAPTAIYRPGGKKYQPQLQDEWLPADPNHPELYYRVVRGRDGQIQSYVKGKDGQPITELAPWMRARSMEELRSTLTERRAKDREGRTRVTKDERVAEAFDTASGALNAMTQMASKDPAKEKLYKNDPMQLYRDAMSDIEQFATAQNDAHLKGLLPTVGTTLSQIMLRRFSSKLTTEQKQELILQQIHAMGVTTPAPPTSGQPSTAQPKPPDESEE